MLDTLQARCAQDTPQNFLIVRLPDRAPQKVAGRMAWALERLVSAGRNGVTAMEEPAPRWSHYIYKLRRAGISIKTEHEAHGGPYAGHHGRYRLTSPLEIERVAA